MKTALASLLALAFLCASAPADATGSHRVRGTDFEKRKSARVAECRAIPADEYSTGLLFNPAGYQTFYHRSECFQELAVAERDIGLCDLVRERDSWFFDGWYVSPRNCRLLVDSRRREDDRAFAELDPETIARLTGLRIRRNGNGRDFDILVTTEGTFGGEYLLEIFLDRPGMIPARLHEETVRSGLLGGTRFLLLRGKTLTDALDDETFRTSGTLRAELRLTLSEGNRFYYHRLPADRLTSTRTIPVDFAELPDWKPETLPHLPHAGKTAPEG